MSQRYSSAAVKPRFGSATVLPCFNVTVVQQCSHVSAVQPRLGSARVQPRLGSAAMQPRFSHVLASQDRMVQGYKKRWSRGQPSSIPTLVDGSIELLVL
jgi:hypothetical protein